MVEDARDAVVTIDDHRRLMLGNAAAVASCEHVFDSWDVHDDVARWLDPRIARECWSLFEARLDAAQPAVLRQRLTV